MKKIVGKIVEKFRNICEKIVEKSCKNCEKLKKKLWKNCEKLLREHEDVFGCTVKLFKMSQ